MAPGLTPGLGDLGLGGHEITTGKLGLYTLFGGIPPEETLPISFDVGCNGNGRNDPFYLGVDGDRDQSENFYELVNETVQAVHELWPNCVFQFEDFSQETAFELLRRNIDIESPIFNDDLSGTGIVAAAAVASGLRAASLMSGREVTASEQRVCQLGAGVGGLGVSEMVAGLMEDEGTSAEEARSKFFLMDKEGVVTKCRKDLTIEQVEWAQPTCETTEITSFGGLCKEVKPTILLGLSTVGGAFDSDEVLGPCCENEQMPIVLALSNPNVKAEISAIDCHDRTTALGNTALYASGSPMAPPPGHVVPTQCNNSFAFPGIGLACKTAGIQKITQKMFRAAAKALANMMTEDQLRSGMLLPEIAHAREAAVKVATGVAIEGMNSGLARAEGLPETEAELEQLMRDSMWNPADQF
ncbi:malic oxidoreductase [Kipferlia bialata]|uniref:Malic oxidoreductase n=1 Tax=Kipferlia bialata TaxID=797122 RepID=A0A9K3CSA2_9EUKA|nr:malic oxidoreductase [Kipferlia bialata]|eukprot:g2451.t1